MPLIPANTKLPSFRLPALKDAIERRRVKLRQLKYGQPEKSLWLMGEIEHLVKLLSFNEKRK